MNCHVFNRTKTFVCAISAFLKFITFQKQQPPLALIPVEILEGMFVGAKG